MLSKDGRSRIDQLREIYSDMNRAFEKIDKLVIDITHDSELCCLLLQEVCRGTASICGLCAGDWACKEYNKQEKRICEYFYLKNEEYKKEEDAQNDGTGT